LYKDNPFYKVAEHLFIGVSIGYVVTKQYYDVLRPKLIDSLFDGKWWFWIAAILAIALLMKQVHPGQLSPRVLTIELAGDGHWRIVGELERQT
jgi:hypothetical protein